MNRALGWSAALEGNHLAAFARLRECADLAPSLPWRIATTLDRAFLAAEMRQTVILHEEMLRAGRFARAVEWDTVVGEEASVLLELAEANARDDAALAQTMARPLRPRARISAASPAPRIRRPPANRNGARRSRRRPRRGRTDKEAVSARREALGIWVELKHDWRAARTAVALAEVSICPRTSTAAVHRAQAFRRSWLGRRARSISRKKR